MPFSGQLPQNGSGARECLQSPRMNYMGNSKHLKSLRLVFVVGRI